MPYSTTLFIFFAIFGAVGIAITAFIIILLVDNAAKAFIVALISTYMLLFVYIYILNRIFKHKGELPHSTSTTPAHLAPPPVFVSVAFLVLPDGSRVELRGDAVLGRSWVASIFPNAPWLNRISEAHAVIRRKTDGWYIEDLGSQYGTYVNGRDIRGAGEVKLNPGDIISLGGVFTLVFQT